MTKDALLSYPSDQYVSVDTVLVKIDPLLFALTKGIASYELASWECDSLRHFLGKKLTTLAVTSDKRYIMSM